ncbi:CIA30 family protein [Nereida sp. MMG025]|uniref:CIA30 family protein n=1 Tax=Nereida sp. MMG025 TaxID=2909981 RepID=UPI001F32D37E|nr:CIA30 family protein [Nereida sp. MMG025]MCF6444016.1 CIA30 family protein [Nereida sp. MMG025]
MLRAFLFAVMVPTMSHADTLIDDFSGGAGSRWSYVSDQVMGGVSEGQAALNADGFIHLTGEVSTDNNGGFIQVRRDLDPLPQGSTAIVLRVKGDGQTYYMNLRTTQTRRPWHSYRTSFETTGEWQEVVIALADLAPSGRGFDTPLDITKTRSIGLMAYGRDHTADLKIAEISVR